ncbi:MAG: response regulator transcription factor [Microbacterium gubbeenense]
MMTSEPLAWVIDDEPAIVDIVTFALETQGFRWRSFHAAGPAWTALRSEQPDLIVLDVMLPDMTGIELCRRIRDRWNIPVLLLTAKGESSDRIRGLEAGADDYVTKPFHPRELALRAQVLAQRHEAHSDESLTSGDLRLQVARHEVFVSSKRIMVTPSEFRVLHVLVEHAGETMPFARLVSAVWGDIDRIGNRELLKTTVYRLRRKLDAVHAGTGARIRSVRGVGYVFDVEPTE